MKALALLFFSCLLHAQDAREIVRRSVERDQANWLQMRNYTWTVLQTEKQLDAKGSVKSEETQQWETVVLDGEPHHRNLAKNGHPLSAADQRKQQEKLDAALAKLQRETPAQRERRIANREKERQKDREFLREIPASYDFDIQGSDTVDGRAVWIIGAKPKTNYQAKDREAKVLSKIRAKLWIDQAEYQWVRLEAETIDTVSFGLFLARVAPGAKIMFEQTRINGELWLPKRMILTGSAKLALVKKLSSQQELVWSNYKKFQVDSKMVAAPDAR